MVGWLIDFFFSIGEELLSDRYRQDSKMSFIIKALYTMAHGLHDMASALCGPGGACAALYPFNGTLFKVNLLMCTTLISIKRQTDYQETKSASEI